MKQLKRAAYLQVGSAVQSVFPARENGIAIPTPKMRDKVVKGFYRREQFINEGAAVARTLSELLAKNGLSFRRGEKVYEWGCGVGRVIRHLLPTGVEFTGSDVDEELVRWCQKNLPGHYFVNPYMPPVDLPSSTFDVIYSISVFTHITQEAADAWIRELVRIAKPDARIVISLLPPKGDSGVHIDERPETVIKRNWLGAKGAPAIYLDTWHDIDWLMERWKDVVTLQDVKLAAIRGRQNVLLLRPVKG